MEQNRHQPNRQNQQNPPNQPNNESEFAEVILEPIQDIGLPKNERTETRSRASVKSESSSNA